MSTPFANFVWHDKQPGQERLPIWTLFLLLAGLPTYAFGVDTIRLELLRTSPIEGIREPSGLTIKDGKLYTVSDDVDDVIYELKLPSLTETDPASATQAVIAIQLQPLAAESKPSNQNEQAAENVRDLEGITTSGDDFLVLAERQQAVLRVSPTGQITSRQSINDFATGRLFATHGAGPEGIATIGPVVVVTGERQPCGLVRMAFDKRPRTFDDDPGYPQAPPRPKDATGLWRDGDELWCLSRNAESIVRMDATKPELPIVGIYIYAHHQRKMAYSDERFGTAEGLAADMRHIYVVLDNNGLARKNDPEDHRPLLLMFKRPKLK